MGFFPPAVSPYSPSEMRSSRSVPRLHGMFPLLMVRRYAAFLARGDNGGGIAVTGATGVDSAGRLEGFRSRTSRLLDELGAAISVPSAIWNVRVLVTLLEYCNCLILRVQDRNPSDPHLLGMRARPTVAEGPEVEATRADNRLERAWFAIEALSRRPFDLSPSSTFKLYAEMFAHVSTWAPDLQTLLPVESLRHDAVQPEDLYLHLGEIILLLLDGWITQVKHTRADERTVADFCSTLPAIESTLGSLRSCFEDLQASRRDDAQRLLQDVRRIQEAGQQVRDSHMRPSASALGAFGALGGAGSHGAALEPLVL